MIYSCRMPIIDPPTRTSYGFKPDVHVSGSRGSFTARYVGSHSSTTALSFAQSRTTSKFRQVCMTFIEG